MQVNVEHVRLILFATAQTILVAVVKAWSVGRMGFQLSLILPSRQKRHKRAALAWLAAGRLTRADPSKAAWLPE